MSTFAERASELITSQVAFRKFAEDMINGGDEEETASEPSRIPAILGTLGALGLVGAGGYYGHKYLTGGAGAGANVQPRQSAWDTAKRLGNNYLLSPLLTGEVGNQSPWENMNLSRAFPWLSAGSWAAGTRATRNLAGQLSDAFSRQVRPVGGKPTIRSRLYNMFGRAVNAPGKLLDRIGAPGSKLRWLDWRSSAGDLPELQRILQDIRAGGVDLANVDKLDPRIRAIRDILAEGVNTAPKAGAKGAKTPSVDELVRIRAGQLGDAFTGFRTGIGTRASGAGSLEKLILFDPELKPKASNTRPELPDGTRTNRAEMLRALTSAAERVRSSQAENRQAPVRKDGQPNDSVIRSRSARVDQLDADLARSTGVNADQLGRLLQAHQTVRPRGDTRKAMARFAAPLVIEQLLNALGPKEIQSDNPADVEAYNAALKARGLTP